VNLAIKPNIHIVLNKFMSIHKKTKSYFKIPEFLRSQGGPLDSTSGQAPSLFGWKVGIGSLRN